MEKFITGCVTALIIFVLYIGIGLFVSWVLMLAWNLLVPALFHGPSITYAMACAIYFLLALISGAFKATIMTTSKD